MPVTEIIPKKWKSYPAPEWAAAKSRPAQSRDSETARAFDYFVNSAARTGWGTPSLTETTEYELVRLSFDYWLMVTLYENHWISRRIVDVPARDMVRAWPGLTSDIDPDDITKIDRAIRRTRTRSQLLKAIQWARLFGGAGALIVIDGHENKLDEPLNLDEIELGAFKGLIPFDRWVGITPWGRLVTDINKPRQFNLPEFYQVQNYSMGGDMFNVHSSRVLRFTGLNVPSPEYEAHQYWGVTVLAPVYEEIRKRDNISWNMVSLSFRANLIGIQFPELAQMLSGAGMSQSALMQFNARMQALNHLMSNQNLLMLPKDGALHTSQYSFAGYADIYQMSQMDISGAAEIPITRLYGRTLTGLGQSNDADERIYEEKIALDQDDQLRPQLEALYPVICMSELGEVPDDLDLTFPSIRVLDEKERADLGKSIGDGIGQYVNLGLYDKATALKEIKQSSKVTELGTNITDEMIEEAEKEVAEQKKLLKEMPELGLLGGPGEQEEPGTKRPGLPKQPKPGKPGAKDSKVLEHISFAGIPVSIEYFADTRRTIKNSQDIVVYDRLLQYDYGFIDGVMGRDGDELDVILGPNSLSRTVYVADMKDLGVDVDQRQDEDKVLLGFDSEDDARDAFLTMYPPEFLANLETYPLGAFMTDWLGMDMQQPPNLRHCRGKSCCGSCGYFQPGDETCQMFGGYPVSESETCDEFVAGMPRTMRANDSLLLEDEVRSLGRAALKEMGVFCPECDSTRFSLMPSDFETAKCANCGKTWEVGIVPGLNAPARDAFRESEHPRVRSGEHGGEFTKGSGGGASNASAKLKPAPTNREKWPSHIKKLRIPPAWQDVRINPDPKGDLQAVGTDIKGRQQYLYSEDFKKRRAGEKFARIKTLSKRFGEIERQNQSDLRSKDPARRENAACARLVMKLGLRPGSDKDTKAAVQAHGATTLEGRHVVERRGQVYLKFVGKKGVSLDIPVEDPDLAKMLADRAERAGRSGKLFPDVTDKSLLDYTHSLDGGKFKTKDLRTHIANEIASSAMQDVDPPTSEKEYKKRCKEVAAVVAEKLGNTPTVALQSYINPEVFAPWRAAVEMGPAPKPAQPKAKEFRKSWVKPRNKRLSGTEIKDLASTVLSNGGKTVETDAGDYDQWQLPDRGEFKSGKTAKLGKTEPNSCHGMAARAWKAGLGTLYTGFARGIKEPGDRAYEESDAWVMHSWVVDPKGNVIEGTPYLREGYYGYPMTDKEAEKFWRTNRDNVFSKGFKTY